MKRNFVPLLGIAFVVAVACTGIFYGLVAGRFKKQDSEPSKTRVAVATRNLTAGSVLAAADVELAPWPAEKAPGVAYTSLDRLPGSTLLEPIAKGDLILAPQLSNADRQGAPSSGVPAGMRAVSAHVYDSAGIIPLLRSGQKVDIQVVASRNPQAAIMPDSRTILHDIAVFSVSPQSDPSAPSKANVPVVTFLATPAEADLLAAADSGAKVRLTLRNPIDEDRGQRPAISIAALLGSPNLATLIPVPAPPKQSPAAVPSAKSNDPAVAFTLTVRTLVVRPSARAELRGVLEAADPGRGLRVIAIRGSLPASVASSAVATSTVDLTGGRAAAVQVGANDAPASVRVALNLANPASATVRISPEVKIPGAAGPVIRRTDTSAEVGDGRSIAILGILTPDEAHALIPKIAPAAASDGELIIIATRQSKR